jgi:2-oxoglutarate ferredoxin oxidoreductase subunit beta
MSDAPDQRPDRPAGTAKPAGPPGVAKPATPPGAVKPAMPPGAKPAMPPGATKPAMPPGAVKPAMPPGATKPAMPGAVKPALPPGQKPPAGPGPRPAAPPAARVVPLEGDGDATALPVLTRQDFVSDQDVRWCPGCGDYAILAAVQRALPELVERRENVVFISGIGCSSRFPYYLDTYGFHTIHGRAPVMAMGLKVARPELDVWVVTGDGDALSIGAGHFVHLCRRNLDVQVLLFNNQIYGLTKGQYSPTSEPGKVTKSTPFGSVDHPFNPASLAMGAGASFVARTLDRDAKHMQAVLRRAADHRGTSFVELYQNCNIFNDGAFFGYTERETKAERALFVEHGRPLLYDGDRKGLRLDGLRVHMVDLEAGASADDCLVYDETDRTMATIVAEQLFTSEAAGAAALPRPFGILYSEERTTYDAGVNAQMESVRATQLAKDPAWTPAAALPALLRGRETWTIE